MKSDFQKFKKRALRDPELKAEYDALEEEFELIQQMITLRREHGLTQAQLAEKAGMKQSAIARLEGGGSNPRFKTLNHIAQALDKKISFAYKK